MAFNVQPEPERVGFSRVVGRVVWAILGWVPVTPLGAVSPIALLALYVLVARPRKDMVLSTLTLAGVAYQALAIAMVVVTGLWLRFRPQGIAPRPMRAEVGEAVETGFSTGMAAWNPLTRVEITWKSAKGAAVRLVSKGMRTVEEVTAIERMAAGRVDRQIVVGDIAHLARVRFVRARDESITVQPSRGAIGRLNPASQRASGDEIGHPDGKPEGELIEMRRYAAGDPLKLVLWKLYARTGRLMVRTPERSLAMTEATRAYLVSGQGDEAAAGIARAWIESGGLGLGSAFVADGMAGSTKSTVEALDGVVKSVRARSRGGEGLAEFLDEGDRLGVRGGIVFVSGRPGPWLDKVVAAIADRGGDFRVIVGIDGLRDPGSRSLALRLLTRGEDRPEADAAGVVDVVNRLASTGAEVRVVDRVSGRTVRPEDRGQVASKEGGRS